MDPFWSTVVATSAGALVGAVGTVAVFVAQWSANKSAERRGQYRAYEQHVDEAVARLLIDMGQYATTLDRLFPDRTATPQPVEPSMAPSDVPLRLSLDLLHMQLRGDDRPLAVQISATTTAILDTKVVAAIYVGLHGLATSLSRWRSGDVDRDSTLTELNALALSMRSPSI